MKYLFSPILLMILVCLGSSELRGQTSGVSPDSPTTAETPLTAAQTEILLDSVKALLVKHYYDKDKSDRIVQLFSREVKNKKYQNIVNRDSLSNRLTADLRRISGDNHLFVQRLRARNERVDSWEEEEKRVEINTNFGFTELQILSGNIGYMRIMEFMHPQRTLPTAIAAMKYLENTSGLIIDLRGNTGGYAGTMEYILNHYFEGEPILLSKTHYANHTYSTTYSSDLVVGRLRVNTPLCILIDKNTASASEFLAYTLQSFGKATIVGERSAGGANRNEYFGLPFNYRISISVASPVNVITNTNWEGTGVNPDISTLDPKKEAHDLLKKRTEPVH